MIKEITAHFLPIFMPEEPSLMTIRYRLRHSLLRITDQ